MGQATVDIRGGSNLRRLTLTMLSARNLMNQICNVVFAVFITLLAVPFMDLIFGSGLVLFHRLNRVENLITALKCAWNFIGRHGCDVQGNAAR